MKRILITGASGTLGSLLLAECLEAGRTEFVIAPLRQADQANELIRRAGIELAQQGKTLDPKARERLSAPAWPVPYDAESFGGLLSQAQPDWIFHAAGCLHYFDEDALREGNENLTAALVGAAEQHSIERFLYISTAFSSGYSTQPIRETLHLSAPDGVRFSDPTPYTASKRKAEEIVATSALPWLIIRPSVVIGDSRDGHYTGRRYGVYQLWTGVERHLLREPQKEIHYVATETPTPLLHQDAFVEATFFAAETLKPGQICHLTSAGPSAREVADLFFRNVIRPDRIHYYTSLDQVDLRSINRSQRSFLAMASTNIEISSHPWEFETTRLEELCLKGLRFAKPTTGTLKSCQDAFVRSSPRLRRFFERTDHSLSA